MTTMLNRGTHFIKLREWIPLDKLMWGELSNYHNKVTWGESSNNHSPNAIHILEQNLDKVKWTELSRNPNAIPILEKNLDKVDWFWLSKNPNIFTYNYKAMKDRMCRGGIKEDLMKDRFHPINLDKFKGWGFEVYDDDE